MRVFADLVRRIGRRGDETVLVCEDKRLSGRDLASSADRLSAALVAKDVGRGDRVCLWLPNSAEFVVWELAAAQIGAIVTPIHTRYGATELGNILGQAQPKLLVYRSRFLGIDFDAILGMVLAGRPDMPKSPGDRVVWLEGMSAAEVIDADAFAGSDALPGDKRLQDAIDAVQPSDGAVCIFTSGTTGIPKGALLSQRAILKTEHDVGDILGFNKGDPILYGAPLASVFGCCNALVASMSHDACLVVLPSFDPGAALDAIERERCSAVYGVPTMFVMMLAHPDFRPERTRSLRGGIVGGAPCSPQLADALIHKLGMRDLVSGYGMSETCAVISSTRIGDPVESVTGTVGRPIPGCQVQIRDPDGPISRACGDEGEICVRGSNLMIGYLGATGLARPFDDEGWFRTGDLGVFGPDGNLCITGRKSDMILVGGFNVYPVEIENLLCSHPAVNQAHVVAIDDERLGERPVAFVQLNTEVAERDLAEFCLDRIAKYKIPSRFHFVDSFPMTPLGKIKKFELKKMAEKLHDTERREELT